MSMNLHEKISRKYQATHRIYSALFELTHRCLCDCIHCFLLKTPKDELSLPEIASLFEQLAGEGTIELTFSGGEPLMRNDFFEILALAHKHHFMIDILTTGLLLGKTEINFLQKYGVNKIELSLLGANPATHDTIMNFPGAFERLKTVVPLLKAANMLVALKTTIIRPNWQELAAMVELGNNWGVRFSASLSLVPKEDRDPRVGSLFLTEEELRQINWVLIDGALLSQDEGAARSNFVCRAGVTTVGISPSGDIFPCVLMREKAGNIREQSLQEIWHKNPTDLIQNLRALKEEDMKECIICTFKSCCPRCPGIAYQETGQLATRSPSACLLARAQSSR